MNEGLVNMIVVTDLEGTLLDLEDNSYTAAMPALNRLRLHQVPWVINSNRTLAELSALRERLLNPYPLVVENGSGIVLPKGFEGTFFARPDGEYQECGDFFLKPMGLLRDQVLERLEPAYQQFKFTGFGRMNPADLAGIANVSEEVARNALDRHFNEPIVWRDSEEAFAEFQQWAEESDLHVKRGYRFMRVSGKADKGASMAWLLNCFTAPQEGFRVVALGDGATDIPMLEAADIAVIIRSPRHSPVVARGKERTVVTDEYGSKGWNTAILDILDVFQPWSE